MIDNDEPRIILRLITSIIFISLLTTLLKLKLINLWEGAQPSSLSEKSQRALLESSQTDIAVNQITTPVITI